MAFNINEISSRLVGGGARPTLFQARVIGPSGPVPNFEFLCRAAVLPETSVGFFEVPYFGRKIKLAGNRTYGEWAITVMNDEDFRIRHSFENWASTINSIQTNRSLTSSPVTYKKQAEVIQYGKAGDAIRRYTFVGLFPTVVSPIQLDWNATDQIEEFSVTFQYDYFTVDGGPGVINDGPSTSVIR